MNDAHLDKIINTIYTVHFFQCYNYSKLKWPFSFLQAFFGIYLKPPETRIIYFPWYSSFFNLFTNMLDIIPFPIHFPCIFFIKSYKLIFRLLVMIYWFYFRFSVFGFQIKKTLNVIESFYPCFLFEEFPSIVQGMPGNPLLLSYNHPHIIQYLFQTNLYTRKHEQLLILF